MVIVGFAGGDMGVRGRIKAYDAKTGKLLWTFYTIPAPGEFGGDTWPSDNEVYKYGGAAIWQTPAIDPELGLVYFTTGNAGPDLNGAVRKGDNLFTVSMLALDVKTGKYAGTSSRCVTTSGITTRRIPSCCSMRRTTAACARASRRSPRPAGSTSSIV